MSYTEKQKWLLGCIKNYNEQAPADQQLKNPFEQKVIPMNNNGDYDVDMSKSNVMVQNSNLHCEVELSSINLFNDLISSLIEFKHHYKTTQTGNLFIEFETDSYGNGIFRPSGLSTTKAKYYFFSIDLIPLFLPVEFLLFLLENRNDSKIDLEVKDNSKTGTDNIGNGLIIPFSRIIELYKVYMDYKLKLKLKEISLKNKKS